MEENTIGNPWMVENIMVFSYFCCPECEFQGKTEKLFENHALENHPMAKDFFIKIEESADEMSATDATPVTFDINLEEEEEETAEVADNSNPHSPRSLDNFNPENSNDLSPTTNETENQVFNCQKCDDSNFNSLVDLGKIDSSNCCGNYVFW